MDYQYGLYYLHASPYAPSTVQFLTRDQLSSLTLTPYQYGGNNPLNSADPTGALSDTAAQLCSYGNTSACQSASAAPQYTPLNLCLRNPIGNNNGGGGCTTTLSTNQAVTGIGIALGAGAAILSGGAVLEVGAFGLSAGAAGTLGAVTGGLGASLDLMECLGGHHLACIGAALGGAASGIGFLPVFGVEGLGFLGGSFALGAGALGWDAGSASAQMNWRALFGSLVGC